MFYIYIYVVALYHIFVKNCQLFPFNFSSYCSTQHNICNMKLPYENRLSKPVIHVLMSPHDPEQSDTKRPI